MKIEEFLARIEKLGFVKVGVSEDDPPLCSYDPPANLRSAFYAMNTGTAVPSDGIYHISFQAQTEQGRKCEEDLGDPFPLCEPSEELLAALESGPEEFLRWFNSRPVASFAIKREGGLQKELQEEGIIIRDQTVIPASKSIN